MNRIQRALRRLRPVPIMAIGLAAALLAASSAAGISPAARTAGRSPAHTAADRLISQALAMGNLTDLADRLSAFTPDQAALAVASVPAPAAPAPAVATPMAPGTAVRDQGPSQPREPQTGARPAPVATPGRVVRPAPSTAPFGSVLIDGCSWAAMVPGCSARLSVYSNGGNINGRFDCMQLVRRWLRWAWNDLPAGGSAAQLWDKGPTLPVPLAQHGNGGPVSPNFGDVLVFAATPAWPAGHVAVVAGSHSESGHVYLDSVEQNGDATGRVSFPVVGTTVNAIGRTPLLGWLRPAAPGGIPRPSEPSTITAEWSGGGGSWAGSTASFQGPGGATITGHWSGFMCLGVRHQWPDGSLYTTLSCYWNGASAATPDPPSAPGTYTVTIEPGDEPPL